MKMTANKYCKIKIEEKYKIQITKTAISKAALMSFQLVGPPDADKLPWQKVIMMSPY